MSLTFPRAMPATGVGQQVFEPDRADFLSRDGAGRLGAIAAGFPLWKAQWTLAGVLTKDLSDQWRAFLASLDGPSRLFLGYDVERRAPKAYPGGFPVLGWNGDCSSWSQAVTAGVPVLTLHGPPTGFQIGQGDYVGFRWTTGGAQRRALVRSLEAVTGDGSAVATFAITPAVPAITSGSAVAYLANPECLMRIDPKSTAITAMNRRRVAGAQIVAVQDLLA